MNALPAETPVHLRDAITREINMGEKDPLTIARNLARNYGVDWIAVELAQNWEEIIAEIARKMLGDARRSSVVSLSGYARQQSAEQKRTGKRPDVGKRPILIQSIFVPKRGYIAVGDATIEDLAAVSALRRKLADGVYRWANWFDSVRASMVEQKVLRVRELKGQLPALPAAELEEGS